MASPWEIRSPRCTVIASPNALRCTGVPAQVRCIQGPCPQDITVQSVLRQTTSRIPTGIRAGLNPKAVVVERLCAFQVGFSVFQRNDRAWNGPPWISIRHLALKRREFTLPSGPTPSFASCHPRHGAIWTLRSARPPSNCDIWLCHVGLHDDPSMLRNQCQLQ